MPRRGEGVVSKDDPSVAARHLPYSAGEAIGIGELPVLQRYLQAQQNDQARTLLFSDQLTALFERPGLLVGGLRHMGLLALDLNIDVKNRFIDSTAGFHAGAALGHAS